MTSNNGDSDIGGINHTEVESIPATAQDAVLDLLLLSTVVDLEVCQIELSELIEQYKHFPFFREEYAKELCGFEGFVRRGELQERYLRQEAMGDFLNGLAKKLGTLDARIDALKVVSAILWSDDLQEVEVDFFYAVGEGLQIPYEDVDVALRTSMQLDPAFVQNQSDDDRQNRRRDRRR